MARRRLLYNAGVVDDDVELAIRRKCRIKCFVPRLDVRNVAGHGSDVSRGIGVCDLSGEFGVDVYHDDFGAFGGVFLCYGWNGSV